MLTSVITSGGAKCMISLIRNTPAAYLTKRQVRGLAIYGEKDLPVEPNSNEAAPRKHVTTAGNSQYISWIVSSMGHTLQATQTGKIE